MKNFRAVIDRLEGDRAVVVIGKEKLTIPRAYLPASGAEGDALIITIKRENTASAEGRQQAKDILNEILHAPRE